VLLAGRREDLRAGRQPDRARVFGALSQPDDARGLGEQRLAGFLARHGYSAKRTPRELLARLRNAAEGRAGEIESHARRQVVLGLLAALTPLVAQIRDDPADQRRA